MLSEKKIKFIFSFSLIIILLASGQRIKALSYLDLLKFSNVLGISNYAQTTLIDKTNLTVKIQPLEYSEELQRWNYKIWWQRPIEKSGTLLINNIVVANPTYDVGEIETDFILEADSEVKIIFYSQPSKRGIKILNRSFNTLKYPYTSSVNNHTPINNYEFDILDYFLSDNPNQSLTGSHPLSQKIADQKVYYTKWSGDSFEEYNWDDTYIYLKEDHSGSPVPESYTFLPGKWLKRKMKIGEVINVSENQMQKFSGSTCAPQNLASFPYKIILEVHNPNYFLGGDLLTQDVIIIKYDYTNGTGTDFERSYYSKTWGLVKWELYRNNTVIHTSTFNNLSTTAPIQPDIQASCTNGKSQIPKIPSTISEFVNHLYSCVVLNNHPDTEGVNYWINNLQNKTLNPTSIYTEFFKIQGALNPPLSNEIFSQLLYKCMLFRAVDDYSNSQVINSLANSYTDRNTLVQTVLRSEEFQTAILPKLEHLFNNQVVFSSGNFIYNNKSYYSNGTAFCQYSRISSTSGAQNINTLPNNQANHGVCGPAIPAGSFRARGILYYTNGSAFCQYQNQNADGGNAQVFWAIPSVMQNHGVCSGG